MTPLLPILSGLLLAATLPPYSVSVVLYVALVPLFIFIERISSWKWLTFGAGLSGLMYGWQSLYPLGSLSAWWWVTPQSFMWEYRALLLYSFLAFLIVAGFALFFVVYSIAFKSRMSAKHWFINALLLASLWVLLEYIRMKIITGIGWPELGYSLSGDKYARQLANPFTVYGLSFFIISVNILMHYVLREVKLSGISSFAQSKCMWTLIIFVSLVYGYGYFRLSTYENRGDARSVIAINSPLKTEGSVGLAGFNFYKGAIREALAKNPGLIVLPENALPFLVIDEETLLPVGYNLPNSSVQEIFDELIALSRNHPDTSVVLGLHTQKGEDRFNSLLTIQNGEIKDIYNKRSLLPLAERSPGRGPLRSIEPLTVPSEKESPLLKTSIGVGTPLICSEILSVSLARSKKSDFIIYSGNDSIFDDPLVAERVYKIAGIRAVENRKYLIASTKGSAARVIDPVGNTIADSKDSQIFSAEAEIRY